MAARASPEKIGFESAAESAGIAEAGPELAEHVGRVAREQRVGLREAVQHRDVDLPWLAPRRASHQAAAWRTR